LDATAQATRTWLAETDAQTRLATARLFDPNASIVDPETYYRTGLTATWLLFDGFARKYRISAARFGLAESRHGQNDARRLLLSAVGEAFFNAQLLREGVRIAEADEAFNQRQLADAQARQRVGTGSYSDVLNFKVLINSARSSVIQARQTLKAALHGLAALMGYPSGAFPGPVRLAELVPATSAELNPPAAPALIQTAFTLRPDILQQTSLVARTASAVKESQAALWPQVNLFGNLEGDRTGNTHFENDDFGNALGLNLTYNLFEGGRSRARIKESQSRKREAHNLLLSLKNEVAGEIRQTLSQLTSASKQLELERENAELVKENRDLVEKEYSAGQTSLVRLNDAQRQLTQADVRLARARVALRQAWVRLDTATGEIINEFGVEPDSGKH
jgi:outer membrane protein TolC